MPKKRRIQIKQEKYNKNEKTNDSQYIEEIEENKIDLSKCSGRVRTRPLEFWNFEKIEVRRTEEKLEVIHHKPYFPSLRSQKSKVKGRDHTSVLIDKRKRKASSSSKSPHSKRKLRTPVQHLKEENEIYDNISNTNGDILPSDKDDDDHLTKLADAQQQIQSEESDKIFSPFTKDCSLESNRPVTLSEKLSNMSLEEAESHIKTSLPFLRRVVKGQEASERHRVFIQGGKELQQMTDYLIYHPYSEEQIFFITDFLESKFSRLIERLYGRWSIKTYIWKVLTPTIMIRIAMAIENVTSSEAEKMLMNILFTDD